MYYHSVAFHQLVPFLLRACVSASVPESSPKDVVERESRGSFVDKTGKKDGKSTVAASLNVRQKRTTVPYNVYFFFHLCSPERRVLAHSRNHGSSLACWLFALITLHSIAVSRSCTISHNLSALSPRIPRSLDLDRRNSDRPTSLAVFQHLEALSLSSFLLIIF